MAPDLVAIGAAAKASETIQAYMTRGREDELATMRARIAELEDYLEVLGRWVETCFASIRGDIMTMITMRGGS